jgi:hypothetical protein
VVVGQHWQQQRLLDDLRAVVAIEDDVQLTHDYGRLAQLGEHYVRPGDVLSAACV